MVQLGCHLQWSLLCLSEQNVRWFFEDGALGQGRLVLNTLQPQSTFTFLKLQSCYLLYQFCSVLIFYLLLHSKTDDIFGFISRLELSCVYLVQLRGRVLFPVVLVWQLPHVPSRHSSSLCTSFNFIKMRKYTEILESFHKKLFHRSRWISEVFFSALQDVRMRLSQH